MALSSAETDDRITILVLADRHYSFVAVLKLIGPYHRINVRRLNTCNPSELILKLAHLEFDLRIIIKHA